MPAGTIVFDMDGTLVDTAPDLIAALNWVLSQNGFEKVDPSVAKSMIGNGAGAMIEQGLMCINQKVSKAQLQDMEHSFMRFYSDHFVDQCTLFLGVKASMESLISRNCKLAVCTNTGEELARQILDHVGLTDQLSAICGGDTFPAKKPDPQHLLGTIAKVAGHADRSIMVGDSKTDIDAARAADIPVVAVTFGYSNVPISQLDPDITIAHFDELVDAIDQVNPYIFQAA